MASYLRPRTMTDALQALARGPHVVIAGGTDFYPARVGRPLEDDVLDISALPALREIEATAERWRIPALCTWSGLVDAKLPRLFDGLKAAARDVGGVQIQNAGTICGNVCNASPAADGVPNLLALDAEIELASLRGTRRMPIGAFVLGNRRTSCAADEMVVAIHVPRRDARARSVFLKLGARRYLVISIVMVAAMIDVADGRVVDARVAVGACSPVARRLPKLEAALVGRAADGCLGDVVVADHLAALSPIDDVRGSARYRSDAALTLVSRALRDLAR